MPGDAVLTEVAAGIAVLAAATAVAVAALPTQHRLYRLVLAVLILFGIVIVVLDLVAWWTRATSAALLLLVAAGIMMLLGVQQRARLREDLAAAHARLRASRVTRRRFRRGQ